MGFKYENIYAINEGHSVTEDIYEGGYLRYPAYSQPYCDLLAFKTKHERDKHVNNSVDITSITVKEINKNPHFKQ